MSAKFVVRLGHTLVVLVTLLLSAPLRDALAISIQEVQTQQQAPPPGQFGPSASPAPSPILDVAPRVLGPGDEVRIFFRESPLLEAFRRNPGGLTVMSGGRIAPVIDGSASGGYVAVRAPLILENGRDLEVTVLGYGQRVSWDEPVFAASQTPPRTAEPPAAFGRIGVSIPLWLAAFLTSTSLLSIFLFVRTVINKRRTREILYKEMILRDDAQEAAKRLRFTLERLQQGEEAAPEAAEASAAVPPLTLPPLLIEALVAGQCTLFWGSGLSAQSGYPTWGIALPELLTQVEGRKEMEGLDLNRLARDKPQLALEVIRAKLGEAATLDMLKPLWSKDRAPTKAMRQLAAMPFANVVTSAWDRLPAQVFAQRKPLVLSRLDAESLEPLVRGDAFCVLHVWGAFDRGRVLLTETDYRATITGNPVVARHIASLLRAQTHLFIGASLASIEQYLATSPPAPEGRLHYALVPDDPEIEPVREVMRSRYRLELLVFRPTPDWSGVPRFIEALQAKLGRTPPPARTAAVEQLRIESVELENIGPFEKARLQLDPA